MMPVSGQSVKGALSLFLLEGNLMNPPMSRLPKQLEPYIVSQVLLHWLVDKKFSYPPVPSPASITPPQPFSPGQIHMHRGGEKDRWMDGYGEGGRERDRVRNRSREVGGGSIQSQSGVICMRQISKFSSIRIIHHSMNSRLIQLSMFKCLLPRKTAVGTGYCTQRGERAEQ